jgi:hypothetical protein
MHVLQVFFADDVNSLGSWKVLLRQKLKGHKLEFTRDVNPELITFEVRNNVNHVGLKVNVEDATPPPPIPPTPITWHMSMLN